jgi:Ca2+-binding EF-hand superfamily protein
MSFASAVSAQTPGGPGARGPHMGGQQMGSGPHMSGAQMGAHHRSRHAERMLRLFDTNGDGKITLAEINADQARMFTALDVDGDKSMSVDEIRRRGRSLQIFRTTTLFDLLDANGDGKLSVAEVQAPSKRWFKRYDENGDGVMEASEIPQRHGHRGRRGGHGRR